MENIAQNAEALFTNLEKFLKTETVVGEPIQVGETTIIPLITVSFGCGTGGGNGTDPKGMGGSGGGLGAGARISPNAILVIKNGEVTLLPVKDKGGLGNLLEMVPEIVSKLDISKFNKKEAKEAQEADI
jgi:uncharacterized spore protein YtfJ